MRSNILSKLIFASCVWYSDCAYYGLFFLIKEIGRRLPLQLQCSYQGQQGVVRQPVRGSYKTRFWGGQNLTAVEGNASFFQVNTVSRITGEGRAEFWKTWGPGFDQTGAGVGGGEGGEGGNGWGAINPSRGWIWLFWIPQHQQQDVRHVGWHLRLGLPRGKMSLFVLFILIILALMWQSLFLN